MRVTLVSETYYPQVNGVSRTLGQLVRVLTRMGDLVQVVQPDYGEPPENDLVCLVRSTPIPFYPRSCGSPRRHSATPAGRSPNSRPT